MPHPQPHTAITKIQALANTPVAASACVELLRLSEDYLDFLVRSKIAGVNLERLYVNTCDRSTRKLALLLIAAANKREDLDGTMLTSAGKISRAQLNAVWQMKDDIHNPSF